MAALGTDTWQDRYGLSLKVLTFFLGEMVEEDFDGTWGGPAVPVLSEVHICTKFGSGLAAKLVKFWTSNLNFKMPWFL